MNSQILREPVHTIQLPAHVSAKPILGRQGKIIKRIAERTGARLNYIPEEHSFSIRGRPRSINAAAELLQKTVLHFQYSGLQYGAKEVFNILDPILCDAPAVQLIPASRPVSTLSGPYDGFVFAPASPGAPAVGPSGQDRVTLPMLQPPSQLQPQLDRLVDLAITIALGHPADCDRMEVRLYLGKLVFCDVTSSARCLTPEALLEWTYGTSARPVFDTALPQDTIRSLDTYLASRGLTATKQTKSASLHLESSIPWLQYHPTFTVHPDGSLSLAKLETLGCKPCTVALLSPSSLLDVRLRYVASSQHRLDDPVAAEIRRRAGEFGLISGVQVTVPEDLDQLDLTLTSARVKLKRVYTAPGPLPPPPAPSSSAATATPPAPANPARGRKRASAAAAAAAAAADASSSSAVSSDPLPAVSLKVSVAAVLDNLGGKRLEVTAHCPELNETLMRVHRARRAEEGVPGELRRQLRAVMAHVEDLRRNVEFVP